MNRQTFEINNEEASALWNWLNQKEHEYAKAGDYPNAQRCKARAKELESVFWPIGEWDLINLNNSGGIL